MEGAGRVQKWHQLVDWRNSVSAIPKAADPLSGTADEIGAVASMACDYLLMEWRSNVDGAGSLSARRLPLDRRHGLGGLGDELFVSAGGGAALTGLDRAKTNFDLLRRHGSCPDDGIFRRMAANEIAGSQNRVLMNDELVGAGTSATGLFLPKADTHAFLRYYRENRFAAQTLPYGFDASTRTYEF